MKVEIQNELKKQQEEMQQPQIPPEVEDENPNLNPWQIAERRRTPNLREIVSEEMKEQQQIELVKKNLVMTGIAENLSAEEALEKAKQIILRDLDITAQIIKVERCGKVKPEETRPRLLKLFLDSAENRKNILRNATKLRNSTDKPTADNVFINPDLTWKQQQAAKNLKLQLDQRRRDEPTKTFKIKRGVITEIEVAPVEAQELE